MNMSGLLGGRGRASSAHRATDLSWTVLGGYEGAWGFRGAKVARALYEFVVASGGKRIDDRGDHGLLVEPKQRKGRR
jgi:hypothetical protein